MQQARHVGVALDFSSSSKNALKWAIENMVKDGDAVTIIIVHPKKTDEAVGPAVGPVRMLWEESSSPLISFIEFKEPRVMNDYGVATDVDVIDWLDTLNRQRNVVIAAKIYWGDAREKICKAVAELPLHCLVMGSRGHGTIKRALLGSVSNYALNNASCPVSVVKVY